ncbi:MAG: adenylate/guanylate cyclase domain-containing protein, partial [Dongiaceae bacterium]
MERRLAAILAADVAGYSRLMGADEAGTLAAVKAARKQVFQPLIAQHRGRIVKLMGDGALVEFASAVNAIECAVAVQARMVEVNRDVPADRRIDLRIGVNLGDVIVEGSDIYGDGVNIAARIEPLAEPGGICVSANVYEEVARKLDLGFEDLGNHELRNIAQPVRVYRVRAGGRAAAGGRTGAAAQPAKPTKPSIAVLPFANMSGDPEQEFFADGLTEDILTELSRFRELFVISRTSSARYKGQAADIQKAAQELGVQYVVEGSVRRAGNRVRVTVQLIDAETDRHIWAERYDRELADIFAIQDEVTSSIVATLPGRVEAASRERAARKPTSNMAAYECVLAGKLLHHRSTKADNAEALELLDRAIALDPTYAHAHAWKACVLGQAWVHGFLPDRKETERRIVESLQTALALDDNDSDVHRIFAAVHLNYDDHEKAMYHQERALSLNPNDDLIVVQQGEILTWLGRPEEGIDWIKKAMRLNPYHPQRFWSHLGRAYFVARRYYESVEAFKRISVPDHVVHA